MKRVQVQLTDDQVAAVSSDASKTGRPVAAVIRQAIDDWMERNDTEQKWDRALSAVGAFRSDVTDLSERHDDYLDEGF